MCHPAPQHVPVMLDEVLEWLAPQRGHVIVDGTLGGGGHARALAERVGTGGRIIALDRDPAAVEAARKCLAELPVTPVVANFRDLPELLGQLDIETVDSVLLDLGMSSDQLADVSRGFSFDAEGPLDLRFNPEEGEPAWRILSRLSGPHLAEVLHEFGEERYSRRIARRIVETRRQHPIRTAVQLAQIVRRAVPKPKGRLRIDRATRTFQALRILVNDELDSLETALRRIPECLRKQGRIAVLSFHSLEDRPVKVALRDDSRYEVLTRKPLRPTSTEIARNPRARSAKLRVAARC
jgi:16S rRNA (cytosine1402-N4)-methyltransferase